MINNNNDITAYTANNKIYIPSNYVDSNYSYRFNGDYIIIITNNNCYQNYNTTYCDCRSYNYKNNVVSEAYSCSTNSNNTQVINYQSISTDINDSIYLRERFIQDKGIIFLMFILGLIFAIFLTRERRHL